MSGTIAERPESREAVAQTLRGKVATLVRNRVRDVLKRPLACGSAVGRPELRLDF
jgi:hypothetical protein